MAHNHNNVTRVYKNVIDEVIRNVRESFLNDGVDEQVLQELKQIWESKVTQSRAVEVPATEPPKVRTYQQHPHQQAATRQPTTMAIQTPAVVQVTQAPQYITSRQYIPQQYSQILMPGSNVQTVQHAVGVAENPKGNPPPLRPAYHGMHVPTIQPTRTQQQQQQQMHTLVHPHATTTTATQERAQLRPSVIIQLDGPNDSDSDEDDDDDDDFNDFCQEDNDGDDKQEDSEPLNSEDDVSDGEKADHFDTDNVVVCQYDRITRSKNKWKFHLKDGIMNLNGRDYVFQKANGDAEW